MKLYQDLRVAGLSGQLVVKGSKLGSRSRAGGLTHRDPASDTDLNDAACLIRITLSTADLS